MIVYTTFDSPVGEVLVEGSAGGLHRISLLAGPGAPGPSPGAVRDVAPLADAIAQLQRYLSGEGRSFDLQLAPQGTPFQQQVWRVLRQIPYGTTQTYGQIARAIGRPTACRAVGAANGQNPLPIVVPCHRVIGANGTLTGFAGGLELKRRLLQIEGVRVPGASQALPLSPPS